VERINLAQVRVQLWLLFNRSGVFLIVIVGVSPIGSTRHYGHQQAYCVSPGDYDDREIGGMMIGRGNRRTLR
jgi:hypothetical protein